MSTSATSNERIEHQSHIRSLLSSKALEDNLGVLVYAQVLDGLPVERVSNRVTPSLHGSDILESRESSTAEGLHDE